MAEYILERQPTKYICPKRLTSNKIEEYFGHIKNGAAVVSVDGYMNRDAVFRATGAMEKPERGNYGKVNTCFNFFFLTVFLCSQKFPFSRPSNRKCELQCYSSSK